MKIKLIAPAIDIDEFWGFHHLKKISKVKTGAAPLSLLTLAALVPKDIEVVVEDENVKAIDFEEKVDLIGITFFTYLAPRAYEIADIYRKKGVKVVLGGIHASMMPDEAGQHADTVVIGEAEYIWPKLLVDFRKDNLQKIYKQTDFPDLKNMPIPRWDLVDVGNYSYFAIQIGRGCPYGCEFCSVYAFNGRIYRKKSIDQVVKEVEYVKSLDPRKLIFFVDDNILTDTDYAKELFTRLLPYKLKWWSQASIDKLQDEDMLELMYRAGCREVFIGLESISEKSLADIGKTRANKIGEYESALKKIHQHGIAVFGSFMFGSDTDDKEVFDKTFEFIQKNNIIYSMANILVPLPGTVLREKKLMEGKVINFDWSQYNGDYVCCASSLFSPVELQRHRDELLSKIYDYDNIYQRLKANWQHGVLCQKGNYRKLFSKNRLLFTLFNLIYKPFDLKKNVFLLKSIWNANVPYIATITLAINFHNYAQRKLKK